VDGGPLIAQIRVPVRAGDTPAPPGQGGRPVRSGLEWLRPRRSPVLRTSIATPWSLRRRPLSPTKAPVASGVSLGVSSQPRK